MARPLWAPELKLTLAFSGRCHALAEHFSAWCDVAAVVLGSPGHLLGAWASFQRTARHVMGGQHF